MKIAVTTNTTEHQMENARCIASGIMAHGDEAEILKTKHPLQYYKKYDSLSTWGLRRAKHHMQVGQKVLICERAYLGDRFTWTSYGWNGLNGHANFMNDDVPSDRWEKYWAEGMKPWQDNNGHIVMCGQVRGDASIDDVDYQKWLDRTASKLHEQYPDSEIIWRPHPLSNTWKRPPHTCMRGNTSLEDDLKGARLCVTYNSNSGVVAVYNGIPTVTFSEGSMVYDVSSHDVSERIFPDRSDWGRKIAYTQWLPHEVESGEAWERLRKYVAG